MMAERRHEEHRNQAPPAVGEWHPSHDPLTTQINHRDTPSGSRESSRDDQNESEEGARSGDEDENLCGGSPPQEGDRDITLHDAWKDAVGNQEELGTEGHGCIP